jgi:Na+/H+-translocating membrane pyrophosphatase
VLTSLSLLAAFKQQVQPTTGVALSFDVDDSMVLCGVLIGAMLPMLFSALTMLSVGKAAAEIIEEVRRQFRTQTNEHGVTLLQAIQFATELPEGTRLPAEQEVKPDSDRCVAISTRSSIREMIAPGAFAILVPLAVGLGAGPRCLIGTLAGGIAAGCMMAILMSNAGVRGTTRRSSARSSSSRRRTRARLASSATRSATRSRTRAARRSTSSSSS